MTEKQWLSCKNPLTMLDAPCIPTADRKRRLFGVACARRVSHRLSDQKCEEAFEVVEQFVDGHLNRAGFFAAIEEMQATIRAKRIKASDYFLPREFLRKSARHSASNTALFVMDFTTNRKAEPAALVALLRDIFGNPFRPVTFDPAWRTSTVLALVAQMYESRDFSPMPILADALQDAGCDNPDVLDHCRGPGSHVRGCWLVDQILGKE